MKRLVLLICVMLGCSMVSGCSFGENIKYEDTYIDGQDFQYMFYGNTYEFGVSMAETEDGYYKLLNNYMYYIEKGTMKSVPLCGKTDCLHEKEKAKNKKNCNAYVASEDGYLNLYKNKLYVRTMEYDQEEQSHYSVFYAISQDGSKKNKVCELREDDTYFWLIHRGKIYFTTQEKGKDKKEYLALKSIDLGGRKKIKTLYVLEELFSGEPNQLIAYGNYVYLFSYGYNEEFELSDETRQQWSEKYENRWILYNIQSGEKKDLFLNQKKDGSIKKVVQKIVFWQENMFYTYYDLDEEGNDYIYKSKLDGTKEEQWMKLEDKLDVFTADEQYLYVYNTWTKAVEKGTEKPTMQVYDWNGNKIDYFEIGVSVFFHFAPGSKEYFFVTSMEETQDCVGYIDKKKIGDLQGKPIDIVLSYALQHEEEEVIEN